jgi:hypothetical protein
MPMTAEEIAEQKMRKKNNFITKKIIRNTYQQTGILISIYLK